jgi:hypothetical protein
MKTKSDKKKVFYIFCIFLTFIFIGSALVFTTSNNLQPAFSQGYIPPPPPLTTSTNQNDQIANNNNNNPFTSNTIGSSSGQSQLNQGQQQQLPNSNCNTKFMVGCGSTNPTTTSTQQQLPNSNCNTKFMVGCGSTNPTTAGPGSTMQNERMCDPGPCNPPSPTFNIAINTTLPTVDISKDPTQKITTIVTNGFGQGAPNLLVVLQVEDPAGKIVGSFREKTDNDGKNVVSVPVKTPGTWLTHVEISNIAASTSPFPSPFSTYTLKWNAISGETQSNLTSLVNLARTIVTLSDDPREQILTTVKDPTGKGVKDIALTIKITNPDSVSKTFSRITDANGVDQFVIPVDKVGNWVATLTLIDPNGKTVPITDVAWKAIP